MSYGMKAPVMIETQLTADELGFANKCAEESKSLQSLLHGGVSVKIMRENDGALVADFRWKNRGLAIMRFKPFDYLPERTEITGLLTGIKLRTLDEWNLWYPQVLKASALKFIEEDIRALVDILWHFDGDSAKAIEEVLRKMHPEWYSAGLDC